MTSLLDNDAFSKRLILALAEGYPDGFTQEQAEFLLAEIREAELFLMMCRMAAQGELKITVENGDIRFKTTEMGLDKINALKAHA